MCSWSRLEGGISWHIVSSIHGVIWSLSSIAVDFRITVRTRSWRLLQVLVEGTDLWPSSHRVGGSRSLAHRFGTQDSWEWVVVWSRDIVFFVVRCARTKWVTWRLECWWVVLLLGGICAWRWGSEGGQIGCFPVQGVMWRSIDASARDCRTHQVRRPWTAFVFILDVPSSKTPCRLLVLGRVVVHQTGGARETIFRRPWSTEHCRDLRPLHGRVTHLENSTPPRTNSLQTG